MARAAHAIGIAFATLLACKGAEPQPEAQPEIASASEPTAPTPPPAAPTPPTPPVAIEAEPPAPEIVAPPPVPAPEIETHTLTADADPLLQLLGKGVPEAVEVLAVHEHGRERVVLYRLDVLAQWSAGQPDADEILEPLDAINEECMTGYGEPVPSCVVETAAKHPSIPAEIAGYYSSEGRAFELAHVKLESDTEGKVLARKRLYDHGYACEGEEDHECFETKLKVYDMDGDARSEILAVFPLDFITQVNLVGNHSPGALAFVIDKSDFHVQFATTRKYYDEGGDVSYHESDFETSFVARDTNADGHADLVLREVGRESRTGGEEDDNDTEVTRTDQSITCLYELAGDRWVCPSAIGTQLIDGTKLVEITRIPLPPPVPAPAG